MVLKFEYNKEAMDVCQMLTINAVENGRMSKRSSAKLFRFHELLFITDKFERKDSQREKDGSSALSHLARKRGFGLVFRYNFYCQQSYWHSIHKNVLH